jgi:hypothetical protein
METSQTYQEILLAENAIVRRATAVIEALGWPSAAYGDLVMEPLQVVDSRGGRWILRAESGKHRINYLVVDGGSRGTYAIERLHGDLTHLDAVDAYHERMAAREVHPS